MTVHHFGKYSFYLDGYLQSNLDYLKKNVKKDYDAFVLFTGREGCGKSTLAMQVALYCDPTFTVDRVVFTAEQFLEAVSVAKQYQAIVFDETMGYLSSRGSMSKFNKALIKVMSEMRSKNLFIFLCIPNFFMMDWYVAEHRTTGLIHIQERGFFRSYDYNTKKKLYVQGKKYHSYCVKCNFYGKFAKCFPIDKEIYEKKKQDAINQWNKVSSNERRWMNQRNILIDYIYKKMNKTQKEIGEILGLGKDIIGEIIRKIAEED